MGYWDQTQKFRTCWRQGKVGEGKEGIKTRLGESYFFLTLKIYLKKNRSACDYILLYTLPRADTVQKILPSSFLSTHMLSDILRVQDLLTAHGKS